MFKDLYSSFHNEKDGLLLHYRHGRLVHRAQGLVPPQIFIFLRKSSESSSIFRISYYCAPSFYRASPVFQYFRSPAAYVNLFINVIFELWYFEASNFKLLLSRKYSYF